MLNGGFLSHLSQCLFFTLTMPASLWSMQKRSMRSPSMLNVVCLSHISHCLLTTSTIPGSQGACTETRKHISSTMFPTTPFCHEIIGRVDLAVNGTQYGIVTNFQQAQPMSGWGKMVACGKIYSRIELASQILYKCLHRIHLHRVSISNRPSSISARPYQLQISSENLQQP